MPNMTASAETFLECFASFFMSETLPPHQTFTNCLSSHLANIRIFMLWTWAC